MKRKIDTKSWLLLSAKLLAALSIVFVELYFRYDDYQARTLYFFEIGKTYQIAFIYGLLAACVAVVVFSGFVRNSFLRIFWVAIVFAGFTLEFFYFNISGDVLGLQMIKVIVENTQMVEGTVSGYLGPYLNYSLWTIVPFAILMVPPPSAFALKTRAVIVPIGVLSITTAMVYETNDGTQEVFSAVAVPARLISAMAIRPYSGPRDQVVYEGDVNPLAKKIVLIVDESVRGDYLGINNSRWNSTPFLTARSGDLANFGVGVSSGNCSKESRLVLRSGTRPDDLTEEVQYALQRPTMWQFAKAAGMETFFLDAVIGSDKLHSYMNSFELEHIDHRELIIEDQNYQNDHALAVRLAELLRRDGPAFIYVNKNGTHYPYFKSYPSDFEPFDVGDNKQPTISDGADAVIASYLNALTWSVDGFFERLLENQPLDDTILIYTSDHGQSLFENGLSGTHCSTRNVSTGESLVPIIAMAGDAQINEAFRSSAATSKDRFDHFSIFPTLLWAMGYEDGWIDEEMGAGLLGTPPDQRQFFSGSLFAGVRGISWHSVELD